MSRWFIEIIKKKKARQENKTSYNTDYIFSNLIDFYFGND